MNFGLIYDLLFALAGCYVISLYAKVSASGDLNDIKLLLPKKLKPEECLDAAGFLARIKPWMLAFSAAVILTGAVGAAEDMGLGLPHVAYQGMLGLCLLAAVMLVLQLRKAGDEFWDLEEEEEKPRPPRRRLGGRKR